MMMDQCEVGGKTHTAVVLVSERSSPSQSHLQDSTEVCTVLKEGDTKVCNQWGCKHFTEYAVDGLPSCVLARFGHICGEPHPLQCEIVGKLVSS